MNEQPSCADCRIEINFELQGCYLLKNCPHKICEYCFEKRKKCQTVFTPDFNCAFCEKRIRPTDDMTKVPKLVKYFKLYHKKKRIEKFEECKEHPGEFRNLICMDQTCQTRALSCQNCFSSNHQNCDPNRKLDGKLFNESVIHIEKVSFLPNLQKSLKVSFHKIIEELAGNTFKLIDSILENYKKRREKNQELNIHAYIENGHIYSAEFSPEKGCYVIDNKAAQKDFQKIVDLEYLLNRNNHNLTSFLSNLVHTFLAFAKNLNFEQKIIIEKKKIQSFYNCALDLLQKQKITKAFTSNVNRINQEGIIKPTFFLGGEGCFDYKNPEMQVYKIQNYQIFCSQKRSEKPRELADYQIILASKKMKLAVENAITEASNKKTSFLIKTGYVDSSNPRETFVRRKTIMKQHSDEFITNEQCLMNIFNSIKSNQEIMENNLRSGLFVPSESNSEKIDLICKEMDKIKGIIQPARVAGIIINEHSRIVTKLANQYFYDNIHNKHVFSKPVKLTEEKEQKVYMKIANWKGHSRLKPVLIEKSIKITKMNILPASENTCIFFEETIVNESLFRIEINNWNNNFDSFFGFTDEKNKNYIQKINKNLWNNGVGSVYFNKRYSHFHSLRSEFFFLESGSDFEFKKGDVIYAYFHPQLGVKFSNTSATKTFYWRFKTDRFRMYFFICLQHCEHVFEVIKII